MYKISGYLLLGTGIVHNVLGVLLFSEPLQDIVKDGLFNSVALHYDRGMVFWFLFFGFLLMLLGSVVSRLEATSENVANARRIGWCLLLLGLGGAVLMPVSGFWLILPQAWLLLSKRSKSSTNPVA